MIRAQALIARDAPFRVGPVSFDLGPGIHAVVGTREDGAGLLLASLAGRVRATSGAIAILGGPAETARNILAYVPADAVLPDALRVEEALAVAATVRGDPPRGATERLAVLGLGSLANRIVRSLSLAEVRSVAMAEALTSGARVLLIEEPYVALDGRAAPLLGEALRKKAGAGACVIVATASPRDATELSDDQLILYRGSPVRAGATNDPLVTTGASGPRLRLHVDDPRALLAELAAEAAVGSIACEKGYVLVAGREPIELAAAVGRAVVRSGVRLDAMVPEAAPLEELRIVPAASPPQAARAEGGP